MAALPQVTFQLAQVPGCNPEQRYADWLKAGGPLLGNTNIGCGINALTFLSVFTRAQGEQLVSNISPRGTSFAEMMGHVFYSTRLPLVLSSFPVETGPELSHFEAVLLQLLRPGCCTVAKLMRYDDNGTPIPCRGMNLTSGHSLVISNMAGKLVFIDPQQKTFRPHHHMKALDSWNKQCYKYIYLMGTMGGSTPYPVQPSAIARIVRHYAPMDLTENAAQPRTSGEGAMNTRVSPSRIRSRNQTRRHPGEGVMNTRVSPSRIRSRNQTRRHPGEGAMNTRRSPL